MSHTIYTSPGIVLSSNMSGEADRTLSLLTRDFGLLRVKAQSVRKVESKMRFLTQTFSCGIYDYVMTQGGWRLTGTTQLVDAPSIPSDDADFLRIMQRGADIIKSCVQGEEPNQELYEHMYKSIALYNPYHDTEQSSVWYMGFELLMIAQILATLGYFDREKYELPREYSKETVLSLVKDKALLIKCINEALRATHLVG